MQIEGSIPFNPPPPNDYNEINYYETSALFKRFIFDFIRSTTFDYELAQDENLLLILFELPPAIYNMQLDNIHDPVPGMQFESWEHIERYIDAYCNSQDFLKLFMGQYRSKKNRIAEVQHNTWSKCSGCPWFVNTTFPKESSFIGITSVQLEHSDHPRNSLAKIAQVIWYTLKPVNKYQIFEIDHNVEVCNNGFVEEAIDVPLILVKELIPIDQSENIFEVWELEYVTANNLSKKAIQLELDTGSVTIQGLNTFMDKFIKKHSLKCTIDQVLKPKHSKKMKPPIESSSSDLNMDNSCDSSAPHKTRFKGSQESKKKTATRKLTECQQCHKSGHNKA
ncbi:26492_t:CDS:2, partial [Gigaspora margarita]